MKASQKTGQSRLMRKARGVALPVRCSSLSACITVIARFAAWVLVRLRLRGGFRQPFIIEMSS
ncbi:hypothetical protein GTP56_01665 [Duganella sp. FT134W]|uniref:Uncharacterized protein n=1 Tax=Duganella margarita TaxID=2692170 RepID=A0A7X4GYG3_9BURK|nr:hypothetical protein [Duganella margarita]MYM70904.1 hypothetical protein [Duganella margarita]